MSRWFRFHAEAINDPKVQRLSPPLFKTWINLLCLASREGGVLPELADIAFAMRREESAVEDDLLALEELQFIDWVEGVLRPHNWDKWQYKDFGARERMQRHRKRRNEGAGFDVTQTVTGDADVTTQNQNQNRSESDQNREGGAGAPSRKKGTRLPDDWQVSEALQAWVKEQGLRIDWRAETEQFRDYWRAKPGAAGVKLDWDATWRKWMRKAERDLPRGFAASAPADDAMQWRRRLEGFKANALWLEAWGARPGERACQAPQGLLVQYGFADEAA